MTPGLLKALGSFLIDERIGFQPTLSYILRMSEIKALDKQLKIPNFLWSRVT